MHRQLLMGIAVALTLLTVIVSVAEVVIPANAGIQTMSQQKQETIKDPDSHFRGNDKYIKVKDKKIEVKKDLVAFVEINSSAPSTVYLMYPAQYEKYMKSGSPEGVLEFKDITWLFYPIPALLEDQTVYFVTKDDVAFNITYENIQERIDRLFSGEEQLRAGTETLISKGINVVRLTQLIPGLKVRFDLFSKSEFVVIKTIDLARYRKGIKGFDQLYSENELKGSNDHFNFTTSDFDDRYLLIRTENQGKLKYIIRATKESAESGC